MVNTWTKYNTVEVKNYVLHRRLLDAYESLEIFKGYSLISNDSGPIPSSYSYSL